MNTTSSRTRMLLPAALALIVASWGATAAPPDKESPIDKDPSTQMTPPVPPKATTVPAVAATAPLSSDTRMQFDARDSNRDGYIDKSEAGSDAKLLSQFNTLDADKDGKLSAAEFMNAKNLARLTPKDKGTDRQ